MDAYSDAGQDLVAAVRAAPSPFPVLVGGEAAAFSDTLDSLSSRLPWGLLVIAVSMFILLFLLTGSVVVPVKALVLNLLSLSATFGAMVWVFQEGHLQWLTGDFTVTGAIVATIPIMMFCVAFGLSMDYEVFLLSASFAFSAGTTTLFVYFSQQDLGANAATIGLSLALANAGGLVSAAPIAEVPRWQMRRLAFGTFSLAIIALLTTGTATSVWLATAAFVVYLMCDNAVSVATDMEIFSSVPPELIGRAVGFWRLATGLPSAAAPALLGVLSSVLATRYLFAILALTCVVPLVWLLVHRTALQAPGAEPPTTAVTG